MATSPQGTSGVAVRQTRGAPGLWLSQAIGGVPADPAQALAAAFAASAEVALRAVHRRATLLWPGQGGVVLKRYERGVWGDAWRERAARGAVRSTARREAENLAELAALGVPTPRALGWCGSDGWLGVRRPSALWMEAVEHAASLRDALARDGDAHRRWRDELARLVARLHGAGWRHRDLYLQHWLVGARGLVLIDVGRCEREPGMRERWFVKDLAALALSCPANVPARSRLRFAARYFEQRGLSEPRAKRRMLAAALSKARRMAAHKPRYVDPREAQVAPEPSL